MAKKFWNAEVRISQKMYENSSSAMYILRILCIFPLQVKRKSAGIYLKFSPLYAFYSCIIGTAILGSIYYRIYEELNVDKKPTHTVRSTDKFVRLSGMNAFCFLAFYGVFIMPSRILHLFKYIRISEQVDNLIDTTFSKANRYKSICMLTMPLIYNIIADVLDLYANYVNYKIPLLGTLRRNYPYYTMYIVAFAVICTNRYIANCLEVRVVQMNKILREEYLNIKRDEVAVNRTSAVSRASHLTEDGISMIYQSPTVSLTHFRACLAITKVTLAYLKWIKAAQIVNNLFDIIVTVTMLGALTRLVASTYFIILTLEGRERGILELVDYGVVLCTHIMRVLLIIEPWHSCMNELENLKFRVSDLLSLNVDRCCREKIWSFAMILCLRQYKFSACGLFIVDRLLYTSVIDTVVTYLVISLQAEEQDTN